MLSGSTELDSLAGRGLAVAGLCEAGWAVAAVRGLHNLLHLCRAERGDCLTSPLEGEVGGASPPGGGAELNDRFRLTPHPARKASPASPLKGGGKNRLRLRRNRCNTLKDPGYS